MSNAGYLLNQKDGSYTDLKIVTISDYEQQAEEYDFILVLFVQLNAHWCIYSIANYFSINYACYFSVIFKGGMDAVPKGQYEACQVLGMTKSQAFIKVAWPQIYKNILPPMSNEIITLVKDTSMFSVVSFFCSSKGETISFMKL